MCCEECSKYEKCEKEDRLKDDCCPLCEEYNDCVGLDDRDKKAHSEEDSEKDDIDNENLLSEE